MEKLNAISCILIGDHNMYCLSALKITSLHWRRSALTTNPLMCYSAYRLPTGQPPALHVTPKFTTDRQYISYYQRYSPRGICLGSRRPRGNFLAGSASPRPHTVTRSCDRSWLGLEGSALPRLGSNQST